MPFELSLAKITVPGRNHRTNVAAANAVAKAFSNEPLQRGWLSCPSGDLEQSPSRIRTGRQARPAHRGPEVLDSHPIRNPRRREPACRHVRLHDLHGLWTRGERLHWIRVRPPRTRRHYRGADPLAFRPVRDFHAVHGLALVPPTTIGLRLSAGNAVLEGFGQRRHGCSPDFVAVTLIITTPNRTPRD